jgi:hypothetical protein
MFLEFVECTPVRNVARLQGQRLPQADVPRLRQSGCAQVPHCSARYVEAAERNPWSRLGSARIGMVNDSLRGTALNGLSGRRGRFRPP